MHVDSEVSLSLHIHSVHCPFLLGGLSLLPNFQKKKREGLNRISIFREGVAEKEGRLFSVGGGGGCSFYIKNKLKSEICNNKKVYYKQKCFSVLTKNLNWKILIKNLVF